MGLFFFFVVSDHGVARSAAVAVMWFFWWGAGNSLNLPAGEEPSWLPPWRRWALRHRWRFVGLAGVAAGAVNAGVGLAFSQSPGHVLVIAALSLVMVVVGAAVIVWQPPWQPR
jgi:hypothetical protein